jgi:hypothetical protein
MGSTVGAKVYQWWAAMVARALVSFHTPSLLVLPLFHTLPPLFPTIFVLIPSLPLSLMW